MVMNKNRDTNLLEITPLAQIARRPSELHPPRNNDAFASSTKRKNLLSFQPSLYYVDIVKPLRYSDTTFGVVLLFQKSLEILVTTSFVHVLAGVQYWVIISFNLTLLCLARRKINILGILCYRSYHKNNFTFGVCENCLFVNIFTTDCFINTGKLEVLPQLVQCRVMMFLFLNKYAFGLYSIIIHSRKNPSKN